MEASLSPTLQQYAIHNKKRTFLWVFVFLKSNLKDH
jgi:hypothetical protein